MKARVLVSLLLTAITWAYWNHFNGPFHFDDFHTVVNNPAIRDLRNIPLFFTDTRTFSILPSNLSWRPLVSVSLALDYSLGVGSALAPLYLLGWAIWKAPELLGDKEWE